MTIAPAPRKASETRIPVARPDQEAEQLLRTAALETSQAILVRQRRGEDELLQAKAAADKSNAQLLAVLAASTQIAIFATDTTGTIAVFNSGAERMLGYAAADMTERLTPLAFHLASEVAAHGSELSAEFGGQISGFGAIVERARRGGHEEREWTYVRKDGRHLLVNVVVTALRDSQREVTGFLGVATDITERKRLDEALRRSEESLRVTLDSIGEAVLAMDIQGRVTRLNPVAEKLLGFTHVEALGLRVDEVLHIINEETRRPAVIPVDSVLAPGEIHGLAKQTTLVARDGTERPIAHTAAPIRDKDGRSLGVVLVFRDVTEDRQIRQELVRAKDVAEASNRELGAFSYSVAHDLRAPLRSIDGFSQALLDDCSEQLDEDGRKYLRFLRESAQLMAQLIDDMLTLSRVTRSELHREQVDLSALARAAHARLVRAEPGRALEVVIQSGLSAHGDPRLLAVVFDNLLGNAWKFSMKRAGARIEFGTDSLAGERSYFIRDNGAGFDMAYAGKLFSAFQRLHAAEDFEGTGIGLATVKRIIHRHDGRVWAEGEVGVGAVFHFTLGSEERLE
jgi:PAS domain S-box-containing protein